MFIVSKYCTLAVYNPAVSGVIELVIPTSVLANEVLLLSIQVHRKFVGPLLSVNVATNFVPTYTS